MAFAAALIATLTGIMLIARDGSFDAEAKILSKTLMCCSLAMPMLFAFHGLWERNKKIHAAVLFSLGSLLVVLFFLFFSKDNNTPSVPYLYRYFMWNIGFHLAAAFCTFFQWEEENGFWQWNKSLFLRFLLATLYAAVLYGGLALAILAVSELFNIKINERTYGYLFVVIAAFFQPLMFLGGIPQPIDALQDDREYPRGLRFFTQYVLLPLVMVYFVILYAYAGKILIEWNLPKGWVSYMIMAFGIAGILSLLLIHPWIRNEQHKWIAVVNKWYYILLFPLVILQAVAIGVRVSDYGITPNRYIIIMLGLWLGIMAVYFTFSKGKNIIAIPTSLAALCLLCSFGPWGIFSLSINSQYKRLENILTETHLLDKGKLVALSPGNKADSIMLQKSHQVSSILMLLTDLEATQKFQSWIPQEWAKDSLVDKNGRVDNDKLGEKLGVDLNGYYAGPISQNDYLSATYDESMSTASGLDVSGYNRVAQVYLNSEYPEQTTDYIAKNNKLFVKKDDTVVDSLELTVFFSYMLAEKDKQQTNYLNKLDPTKANIPGIRESKFVIRQATLNLKNGKISSYNLDGYYMWK